MHPKGPSAMFKWPLRDDLCWIPFEQIFKVLNSPSTTHSGRNFFFDKQELSDLQSLFSILF